MYEIKYASERVAGQLKQLPKKEQELVIKKIEKKLRPWQRFRKSTKDIKRLNKDTYRLRAGNYRIFFGIPKNPKKTIVINSITDRKFAY